MAKKKQLKFRDELSYLREAVTLTQQSMMVPTFGGHRHKGGLLKFHEVIAERKNNRLIRQAIGGRLTKYHGTACDV